MLRKKNFIKIAACSLLGLLSLTSCSENSRYWFGYTFNLNPYAYAPYSIYEDAGEKYNNVTYTVDESKKDLTINDVFENTAYIGRYSTFSYTKQIYKYVKVTNKDYLDFNVHNRHFDEDTSTTLSKEYVETLKSDPNVIFMFKIVSDDPDFNGRYYNQYIRLVDLSNNKYQYNEYGLKRLYEKAEEEQQKGARMYRELDAQNNTEMAHYMTVLPYIKFVGYDFFPANIESGEKVYRDPDVTVELEEVNPAPLKIKFPYFERFNYYDLSINSSMADFYQSKSSINDIINGYADYVDNEQGDSNANSNNYVINTQGYTFYAKEDLVIKNVSFDVEVKQTKIFDEEEQEKIIQGRHKNMYPYATISNGFPLQDKDKISEWNRIWYGKKNGDWMTGYDFFYGTSASSPDMYECNGTDDWYLKEGYINSFNINLDEVSGTRTSTSLNKYILKKGYPLKLKVNLNVENSCFVYRIKNLKIDFDVVSFKGI